MVEDAPIDAIPCYTCSAPDSRWRGPKLGWLCLRCFSSTVDPILKVESGDASIKTAPIDGGLTPTLKHTEDPSTGEQWTLLIFDEHGDEEPSETFRLDQVESAEEAVNEAKWILEKRGWEHYWAALRQSRQAF